MKTRLTLLLSFWALSVALINCGGKQTETEKKETIAKDTVAKIVETKSNEQSDYWNDLSLYLAGLPNNENDLFADLRKQTEYTAHRKFFDQTWVKKDKEFIRPLTDWRKDQITTEDEKRTVFYPFSGPDFLTVYYLFPNADAYVLTALEPEGDITDPRNLSADTIKRNLDNLQKSLRALMEFSFFRTLDMEKDLIKTEFNGTLPIMLAFLARTEHKVLNVEHIYIDENGKRQVLDQTEKQNPDDGKVTGIEIKFQKAGEKDTKTVQYFSANIRNNFWGNKPGFVAYLRSLKPSSTYIKSASYLMHKEHFSKMRDLVVDVSAMILQDDSGVPMNFLPAKDWDVKLFGQYTGTIENKEFTVHYQPNLRKLYQKDSSIEPLNFGIGYKWQKGQSNLILARKKS